MAAKNLPKPSPAVPPKTAVETPAAELVITIDELIRQTSGLARLAEQTKRATGHLRELSMMLYEAQDRGGSRDFDNKFLSDTAQGIQMLIDCQADDIDDIAGYVADFSKDACALNKQREEGGVR